jgi:hypothetical protein
VGLDSAFKLKRGATNMSNDINFPEEAHKQHWIYLLQERVKDCERKAALHMHEAKITRQWIAELEGELVSETIDATEGRC